MIKDYHVHTAYSVDSNYPIEDVVKDAIKLGIDELCFTDHVDYGGCRDVDDPRGIEREYDKDGNLLYILQNCDYENYFKDIDNLSEKYKGQIVLKKGLEYGIQTHTITDYEKLYKKYPLDFIILSVHAIENKAFGMRQFQTGKKQLDYHRIYYTELLNGMKKFKNYSVVGHIDSIGRYDDVELPFSEVEDIVVEILKTAIADGKGIEINTSSYRYGVGAWTPSLEIVKLYKDFGGKIITIGSDSHKPEHLGAHIKTKMEELKDLGFEYYCTYENMVPKFNKL